MNICTLAVTEEEYRKIINTLESGYYHNGIQHRPNYRVAFAIKLEYVTGMRISDIIRLRQKDIVKDGNRYRLDIHEKKTGKKRVFRISEQIYDAIDTFCAEHGIDSTTPIIGGTAHGIQKQIRLVRDYLGMGDRISSHSFRKGCAQRFYELTNNDIVAVQTLLQHNSAATTYTYLASGNKTFENALNAMTI